MIVVEKEREQSHIVLCRLDQSVCAVADGEIAAPVLRLTVQANELCRLHSLEDIILGDEEVRGLHIGHGLVVPAGDRDVHANEVDTRAKRRLVRLCIVRTLFGARCGESEYRHCHDKQAMTGRHRSRTVRVSQASDAIVLCRTRGERSASIVRPLLAIQLRRRTCPY